ncbi:response regulator [Dyadobacter tibetensis]|uniref:response regulator n=1 Tax=Dyadobacter tibetensis TaxID=1211851 RepID=UPI0004727164|nr:response regulator [Dyadobacter tibetensis]
MKIVIIEDEEDLGVLMRNFLMNQFKSISPNTEVKIAHTLSEGKDCIDSLKPDWVFLDNNLPDGKGINEIVCIRSTSVSEKVTIVMMSAMTNLKEEALSKGADYFLDKPISFAAVSQIISRQNPIDF